MGHIVSHVAACLPPFSTSVSSPSDAGLQVWRRLSHRPCSRTSRASFRGLRTISLLRLSLLRFVDSNFPGNFPMDMRIPFRNIKIMLESDPLKFKILVRRLAVHGSAPSYSARSHVGRPAETGGGPTPKARDEATGKRLRRSGEGGYITVQN